MPYLRPSSLPSGRVPYLVCLPDTPDWRTLLWGAISTLEDSWNREGESPLSDEDISQVWIDVLGSFRRADELMAGIVNMFAGSTPPDGWLVCDGSSIDVSDYPALFNAIGYTFGGSGGSFNVPDMRDKFPVGSGGWYALNDSGGAESVTLSESQIPSHRHSLPSLSLALAAPGAVPVSGLTMGNYGQSGYTGGGGSHENRPPYRALSFIISTGELC